MSESECREQIRQWVLNWYPRQAPHTLQLIRQALELTHCQDDEPDIALCEQEAADFCAYLRRSNDTVRDLAKDFVPSEAVRPVKCGLLVWLWGRRRKVDLTDINQIKEHITAQLAQTAEVVYALSNSTGILCAPFEGFEDWLAGHLWATVFKHGYQSGEEELARIIRVQLKRASSWQKVGAGVTFSVREAFAGDPPPGLANNIRMFLWKYPNEKPEALIPDAVRIAKALAGQPYEEALMQIWEIVRKRIQPPLLNLIRGSNIELMEVVNETWKRARTYYRGEQAFEPSRAAEIPGLFFVVARRIVLQMMKPRPTPPSQSGGRDSEPENPEVPKSFLMKIPYLECPPHQSIAWTWIEVLGRRPRWIAKNWWNRKLEEAFEEITCSLKGQRTDFLEPLKDRLDRRLSQLFKSTPATRRLYEHILHMVCGETQFRHYDTQNLPAKVEERLPALETRPEDNSVRALQHQTTEWCYSVNRAWKTATIKIIFRMELGLE
jgi:hypothetical protein